MKSVQFSGFQHVPKYIQYIHYYHYLIPEPFHHHKRKSHTLSHRAFSILATTNLLRVSMDSPVWMLRIP